MNGRRPVGVVMGHIRLRRPWGLGGRSTRALAPLALVAIVVVGCDGGDDGIGEVPRAALSAPLAAEGEYALPEVRSSAAAGARHYAEHCTACHGPDGRGDGPLSAPLRPPPPDFTARGGEPGDDASPARYHAAISRGTLGSSMKRYDHVLDEIERWDTAFFVWGIGADGRTLERGRAAYAEACARCHGADGRGVGSAPLDRPEAALAGRSDLERQVTSAHPDVLQRLDDASRRALVEHLYTFLFEPQDDPPGMR